MQLMFRIEFPVVVPKRADQHLDFEGGFDDRRVFSAVRART
jgi:hypothetical protein